MKKPLIRRLGLLGIVSFLSYTAAVLFAPLAYPGYDRMAQAVSGLSAANAPSLFLWQRLSVFSAAGFNAALGLHLFFTQTEKGE